MTAKAQLAAFLLSGESLSIMDCFREIGLTNLPREVSRLIEKPFGVMVSRSKMEGKNRFGQPIYWYQYRLNTLLESNKEGIIKMKEYVSKQFASNNK